MGQLTKSEIVPLTFVISPSLSKLLLHKNKITNCNTYLKRAAQIKSNQYIAKPQLTQGFN